MCEMHQIRPAAVAVLRGRFSEFVRVQEPDRGIGFIGLRLRHQIIPHGRHTLGTLPRLFYLLAREEKAVAEEADLRVYVLPIQHFGLIMSPLRGFLYLWISFLYGYVTPSGFNTLTGVSLTLL